MEAPSSESRRDPVGRAVSALGITGAELARRLGISKGALSQWKLPGRAPPIEHCVTIERMTNAAVRRWDLRPDDWHHIWPELIGAEGAPQDVGTCSVVGT